MEKANAIQAKIDLLEDFIEDETLSHIECDSCHKRDNVVNYGQYASTDFYKKGWRVFNKKCLCPKCVKER